MGFKNFFRKVGHEWQDNKLNRDLNKMLTNITETLGRLKNPLTADQARQLAEETAKIEREKGRPAIAYAYERVAQELLEEDWVTKDKVSPQQFRNLMEKYLLLGLENGH